MITLWQHLITGINPVPWKAPEGSVGRGRGRIYVQMHKNASLTAYQEAVKEDIEASIGELKPIEGPYQAEFYFWRQIEVYETDKRKSRSHVADATNLQKALEDACEKLLFKNDRDCWDVHSTIVEQSVDTEPKILIWLTAGAVEPGALPLRVTQFLESAETSKRRDFAG